MEPIIIFCAFLIIVIVAWFIQTYFSLDLATQRELPEVEFSKSV
jgi:p-aminobenzoyl-glutamate transporter AbgT